MNGLRLDFLATAYRSLKRRIARAPTIALLASACNDVYATGIPPMAEDSAGYALAPALRQLVAGSPDDVLGIARTFDTVLDGETFLLADFGNDRILRLDTAFALLDSFGASGSGPGELRGPGAALPWNDRLVVGDWNNSRIVLFDRNGEYMHAIAVPMTPESFGVRTDRAIVMASAQPSHYAYVIDERGTMTPFAERPPELAGDPDTETLAGGRSVILEAAGDTMHVLDDEWGVLLKYAPDGSLKLARSLPGDILKELRSFRADLVEGLARNGHRVVSAPLLKTMAFDDEGSIVIMITHGRTVALVVDPRDYSVRRITAPIDDPAFALVRAATSTLLLNNTLYAFSSAGLASFPLLSDDQ